MSQRLAMLDIGSLEGKPLLFQSQAHLPPGMTAVQKLGPHRVLAQGVRHQPWSATGSQPGTTRWRDEGPWPEPGGAATGLQRGELVRGGASTEQGPQDLGQDLTWLQGSRDPLRCSRADRGGGGGGRGLRGKARVSAGKAGQLTVQWAGRGVDVGSLYGVRMALVRGVAFLRKWFCAGQCGTVD